MQNSVVQQRAMSSFRNEWWYITGNLENDAGKRFGFHITFFRIANEPLTNEAPVNETTAKKTPVVQKDSNWRSNEFYMAHFAVTAEGGEIKTHERFSRSAAGLAGAAPDTDNLVKVWLDDWQLVATQEDDQLVWHLSLSESDLKLDLTLSPEKPRVLQGEAGYSQKSADPCNSSYYYSYTRLKTDGSLQIDDTTHNVAGSSWLDREWSSSALGDNQSGWDWFALQLDDGRDIMLYQLRMNDGSRDNYSHAVEIDHDGRATEIPIENITLNTTRWWQRCDSPHRHRKQAPRPWIYGAYWLLKVSLRSIGMARNLRRTWHAILFHFWQVPQHCSARYLSGATSQCPWISP